jgi:predicted amidohydrolase YtcJ
MPRYIVERTFSEGLEIPVANGSVDVFRPLVRRNAQEGVTWVHSYVYDAPTPEAIRKTAARNELPVDRITQVRVLDPYFYV